MLKVEEWAEVHRLHRVERLSIRAISRRLGVDRKTVARALLSQEMPVYRLISSRYERASVIVTSNKPFTAWPKVRHLRGRDLR